MTNYQNSLSKILTVLFVLGVFILAAHWDYQFLMS